MGGKRKNQKRACREGHLNLKQGQNVMLVTSLRGSNLIEVMDSKCVKCLALFPAKFQKSIWIKKGSFVVVDDGGREKALESGSKIACIVVQVLFHEQVRELRKSPEWPEIFKSPEAEDCNHHLQMNMAHLVVESDLGDEEGLPPLEANVNRNRPVELYSDSDSDS